MTEVQVGISELTQLGAATQEEMVKVEALDLRSALEKPWTWPALAMPFFVRHMEQDHFIRVAKDSELFEQLKDGLFTQAIFLDYDLPNHDSWASADYALDWVDNLYDNLEPEALPFATYTTEHGARLVYRLSRPLPVLEVGPIVAGILKSFAQEGIVFDETCTQWWRLYFLPSVVKPNGTDTGALDSFHLRIEDTWLDPDSVEPCEVPKIKASSTLGKVEHTNFPEPTVEDCEELLYEEFEDAQGRTKMRSTPWLRRAKKKLKYNEPVLAETLFAEGYIPRKGGRDNWLTRNCGTLVQQLRPMEGTTRAHIFALMGDVLDRLEPDEDTPSWPAKAWSMIQRFWAQDNAKEPLDKRELPQEVLDEIEAKRQNLIVCLAEKHPDVEQLQDPETAWEWVERHTILSRNSRTFHILNWAGEWMMFPTTRLEIAGQIMNNELEDLIDPRKYTEDGLVEKTGEQILQGRTTGIAEVEYSCYVDSARLIGLNSERPRLKIPAHKKSGVLARFDSEVDKWLRKLVRERDWHVLENWLVGALETQYPIPLLSLMGVAGSGKQLLVEGLAECFSNPTYCDEMALVEWNKPIVSNPIIHCDEGIAMLTKKLGKRGVSEQVRTMIGGTKMRVKEKFQPEVMVEVNPRIILTANNMELLKEVIGSMQSETDLLALQQRVVHLNLSSAAARHLEDMGGRAFTGDWVGSASSNRLAGHLTHLWKSKRGALLGKQGRFLMEGQVAYETLVRLTFQDDTAADAFAAVVHYVEASNDSLGGNLSAGRAWLIEAKKARVWVCMSGVKEYIRVNSQSKGWRANGNVLEAVLNQLGTKIPRRSTLKEHGFEGKPSARWYELDIEKLWLAAADYYLGVPKTLAEALLARYGAEAKTRFKALEKLTA